MSMITITFQSFKCEDCRFISPGAELRSFNTAAPPPEDFSYDGSCVKCGSANTKELFELDEISLKPLDFLSAPKRL